jgi:hypothetical protein
MIRKIGIFIGLLFAALVIASCKPGGGGTVNVMTAKAQNVVTSMSKSDYVSATKDFDAKMKVVASPEKLRRVWTDLTAAGGAFKGFGDSRTDTEQGYDEVFLKCNFARSTAGWKRKTTAELKFVFNHQKQISGMWLVESKSVSSH